MTNTATVTEDSKDIKFFGEADINKYGNIASVFPAFYNAVQITELKEKVAHLKAGLDSGTLKPEARSQCQADYQDNSKRLQEIEDSMPELTPGEKDRVNVEYKRLNKAISAIMYTQAEEDKNLQEGHQEYLRMSKPSIELKSDDSRMLAKECGVRNIIDNKISRNDASKVWKILGRVLGESTNVASLKREKGASDRVD